MKRFITAALIFSLCFALCACGAADPDLPAESTSDPAAATTETTTETATEAPETSSETTTEALQEETAESAADSDISLLPTVPEAWENIEWVTIETNFLLGTPENISFDAWDICVPGVCFTVFDEAVIGELVKYFTLPDVSCGGDWVRGPSNMVVTFSNGFRCDMVYSFVGEEPDRLYPHIRVHNGEGQPVYYTLSDEGTAYLYGLLQKIEMNIAAE